MNKGISKINMLALLISIVMAGFLRMEAYAKTILFDGDYSSFDALIHTRNLDKQDLLIFAEHHQDLSMQDLAFFFQDSMEQDLAIRISFAQRWEAVLRDYQDKEKEEGSVGLASWKQEFTIDDSGLYEFFIDSLTITPEEIAKCRLKIDGKAFAPDGLAIPRGKYIKIRESMLARGKHRIELIFNLNGQKAEEKQATILLIEKNKRQEARKKILEKIYAGQDSVSYLFKKKEGAFSFYAPDSSQGDKPYNLKLHLKLKSNIQDIFIKGEDTTKDWKTLPSAGNEHIPPLILSKENFYLEDDIYFQFLGTYEWGKKDMRVIVFNPTQHSMNVRFEFSAHSLGKARNLKVFLNGGFVKEVKVPLQNAFSIYSLDLLLKPGINKIGFSCPLWKRPYLGASSVGFKDFRFSGWDTSDTDQKTEPPVFDTNVIFVPQNGFLDILFNSGSYVLLSRSTEVNLEDNPLLSIKVELQDRHAASLFMYLGIDYNDDGAIDGYLRLKDTGDYNVLEMAKNEWPQIREFDSRCWIKRMVLLVLPHKINTEGERKKSVLRLSEINFIRKKFIKLFDDHVSLAHAKIENVNSKSIVTHKENSVTVYGYFGPGPQSDGPEDAAGGWRSEIVCFIPRTYKDFESFPFISFDYAMGNAQEQIIDLFLLAVDNSSKVLRIPLRTLQRTHEYAECDVLNSIKPGVRVQGLIFSFRSQGTKKQNVDWYEFKLSNLKFYNRFPFSLESKGSEDNLYSSLASLNPRLFKIDDQAFSFNDFDVLLRDKSFNGCTLSKELSLSSRLYRYEKTDNETLEVDWAILEPRLDTQTPIQTAGKPQVYFKKINPTRYTVTVTGVQQPFWLVFNENFSPRWVLYKNEMNTGPGLTGTENTYKERFTPADIKYLFKEPMSATHQMVNGFANGWYIDPEKLNLSGTLALTIYYLPQSKIYLGFFISGVSIILGIIFLLLLRKHEE